MADSTTKSAPKTLKDADIATFSRRAGPDASAPGDDADAHSDSDAPVAATDHDTPATDIPATDKDA